MGVGVEWPVERVDAADLFRLMEGDADEFDSLDLLRVWEIRCVAMAASATGSERETALACPRTDRKCAGRLWTAYQAEGSALWRCGGCGRSGEIARVRGTAWDLTAPLPPGDQSDEIHYGLPEHSMTLRVDLDAGLHGDLLGRSPQGRVTWLAARVLAAGRPVADRVRIEGTWGELDHLLRQLAGMINADRCQPEWSSILEGCAAISAVLGDVPVDTPVRDDLALERAVAAVRKPALDMKEIEAATQDDDGDFDVRVWDLGAWFGAIAYSGTARPAGQLHRTPIRCAFAPCGGRIAVSRNDEPNDDVVTWACDSCGSGGSITDLQGTPWDLTPAGKLARQLQGEGPHVVVLIPRGDEAHAEVLDIRLDQRTLDALLVGYYGPEASDVLACAQPTDDGAVVRATIDQLMHFMTGLAEEIEHWCFPRERKAALTTAKAIDARLRYAVGPVH